MIGNRPGHRPAIQPQVLLGTAMVLLAFNLRPAAAAGTRARTSSGVRPITAPAPPESG